MMYVSTKLNQLIDWIFFCSMCSPYHETNISCEVSSWNIFFPDVLIFWNKIGEPLVVVLHTKLRNGLHVPINNMDIRHNIPFEIDMDPFFDIQFIKRERFLL